MYLLLKTPQALKCDRRVYLKNSKKTIFLNTTFVAERTQRHLLILFYSEGSTVTTHPIVKLKVFQGRTSMVEHLRSDPPSTDISK